MQILVNICRIPVDIIKDMITLGGILTGKSEPYITVRLRKLVGDCGG